MPLSEESLSRSALLSPNLPFTIQGGEKNKVKERFFASSGKRGNRMKKKVAKSWVTIQREGKKRFPKSRPSK